MRQQQQNQSNVIESIPNQSMNHLSSVKSQLSDIKVGLISQFSTKNASSLSSIRNKNKNKTYSRKNYHSKTFAKKEFMKAIKNIMILNNH